MSQTVLLGDVCIQITDGTHSTVKNDHDGKCFLLSAKNIKERIVISDSDRRINKNTLENLRKRTKTNRDDILLTSVGTIGETAIVEDGDPNYEFQRSVAILKPDKTKILPKYLLYYLRNKKQELNAMATGAVQKCLFIGQIKNIVIEPSALENQQKIIDILGSIDEKIELNRRMNETLERTGQALFGHYFITNHKSGEKLVIGDVAEVIDCLHSRKPERINEDTGNILLQLNNIKDDGTLDFTDKFFISDEDYARWITRIEAAENDFVITNVGRSGAVAKIPNGVKTALGRNMTGIRLKSQYKIPGFLSFLLNSAYMKNQIESQLDHGTILSALNVKNIPKLTLPTSHIELIKQHEGKFATLRNSIEATVKEIQTLTAIRNSLLPRLISGKIKV